MADASAPISRKDVEAKIIATAWQDDAFRKRLLSDPKGLFEERLNIKLPPSLQISVHEETENRLYFVIPAKPLAKVGELSDQDLEKVAGGVVAPRSAMEPAIETVVASPMVPKVW